MIDSSDKGRDEVNLVKFPFVNNRQMLIALNNYMVALTATMPPVQSETSHVKGEKSDQPRAGRRAYALGLLF